MNKNKHEQDKQEINKELIYSLVMKHEPASYTSAVVCTVVILAVLALAVLAMPEVSAAVVKGAVYELSLEPASAVVTINSTPEQRFVAVDGNYEFYVPIGNYEIEAANKDGKDTEFIIVNADGTFRLDLILFPVNPEDELKISDINVDIPIPNSSNWLALLYVLAAIGALALAIKLLTYFMKSRASQVSTKKIEKSKTESLSTPEKSSQEASLPKAILDSLAAEGGRITQKELRQKLPYSEAKISLAVAELEHEGKIKKIKKGRGNILIMN